MAVRPLKPLVALPLFVAADLLLIMLLPGLRLLIDPLFLLVIAFSVRARSARSLWMLGFGLGFLKDLYTGTAFGAWTFTFTAAAWLIGSTRRMVEWEDPALVGVWAAILTLPVWLFHAFWLTTADPFLKWGNGQLSILPAAMVVQGFLTAWIFPRLRKA